MTTETSYAITILFDEIYYDESGIFKTKPRSIVLDAVSDITKNASNTITTHPIVSGDMVADHAYKEPSTISFTGSASFRGHKSVLIDSNEAKPVVFAELLEQLRSNAYLCQVYKIAVGEKVDDIRFATYSNYVISSYTTVEKINCIDFTLNFQQVMLAEIQDLDVDTSDSFLPNITEPKTASFADTFVDYTEVLTYILSSIADDDMITPEFLNKLGSMTEEELASVIGYKPVSAAAINIISTTFSGVVIGLLATLIKKIVTKILTKLAIKLGVKTIAKLALGGLGLALFIADGVFSWLSQMEKARQYKFEQFKLYLDDERNKQEVQRFSNFVGQIQQHLQELDDAFHLYQISSNDDQECLLSISNNYYIFTFTTNNTNNKRICRVIDIEEHEVAVIQDVESSPVSFSACTSSNAIFRAYESGSWVYLINLSTDKFSLENCYILACDFKPEEYNTKLTQILDNALKYD